MNFCLLLFTGSLTACQARIMLRLLCSSTLPCSSQIRSALPSAPVQPSFVFVGDVFETDPAMRQVKSLLLDYFRGRQVIVWTASESPAGTCRRALTGRGCGQQPSCWARHPWESQRTGLPCIDLAALCLMLRRRLTP